MISYVNGKLSIHIVWIRSKNILKQLIFKIYVKHLTSGSVDEVVLCGDVSRKQKEFPVCDQIESWWFCWPNHKLSVS